MWRTVRRQETAPMAEAHEKNPVPLVDRLAYVLREYEEAHAVRANVPTTINGRTAPRPTEQDPEPEPYGYAKTECECQQCRDARLVLADYEDGKS
jgi:hypothetical protein